MYMLEMAQNSRFSDDINNQVTKVPVDTHLQNGLPWQGYPTKNHSDLLNNLLGIIFCGFKAYLESKFPVECKNFCPLCYNIMLLVALAPFNLYFYLFVITLSIDLLRGFQQRYRLWFKVHAIQPSRVF